MRCTPIVVAYAHDVDELMATSRTSPKLTHYDPRGVSGCAVLTRTVARYLRDDPALLAALPEDAPGEVLAALEPVPDEIEPDALPPTGYVVDTLRVALYHAITASDAETAIANATNIGGDADTIGAVAEARFGAEQVSNRWIDDLDQAGELR